VADDDRQPVNLRAETDKSNQEDGGKTNRAVDIYRLAKWPVPDWLGVQGKAHQLEMGSDLKNEVEAYLQKLGYEVAQGAKLTGKSGVEHVFDMLARKDDGFTINTMAICFAAGGDREVEVGTIFRFANKAYDTGILARILISVTGVSQEAKQLAQKQRIKVIEKEQVSSLLELSPAPAINPEVPFRFETKEQLTESLTNLGYRVEQNARVKGKSGVEYKFDLMAHSSSDEVGQSFGIDFLTGKEEVTLEQVSLFDTKAYEAGVDDKVIVVSPRLSPEANQFAQHQRIRVLDMSQKTAPQPSRLEKPAATPAAEFRTMHIKQAAHPEALRLIPEVMARKYNAIPLAVSGDTLQVAMADPTDIFALEAFSALCRMRIKPVAASPKEVRDAIDFNYKSFGEIEKQLSRISIPPEIAGEKLVASSETDAPLAQALNLIVEEAVKARASDIHIEPEDDRLRVRYRIDGTLHDLMSLPLSIHLALLSRIKILSDLNIADRHRPQDGQFTIKAQGRDIDVRVATTPTVNGEMAELRLLDKSMATLEMSELGMLPDCLEAYQAMLKVPYGMILTSGPTGAGKTTTMYASINSLDCLGRNVITIEDPAEYRFKDINQIQVNPQAGITFAAGLRSILRLDPDVIMIGEIRDGETANIAVQAALTGHLMLSSVHASDAAGVLSRLLDLGIEPFLISSAVIGVIAQRMVRRICLDCSHLIEVPLVEQMAYEREMGEKRTEFFYGTGCKSCAYTGYLGRTGLFELMTMTDNIRELITSRASIGQIRAEAVKGGMITMMTDGMRKVKAGITTPSEILRSAYSPD
jgi:general secretion pathway protein E